MGKSKRTRFIELDLYLFVVFTIFSIPSWASPCAEEFPEVLMGPLQRVSGGVRATEVLCFGEGVECMVVLNGPVSDYSQKHKSRWDFTHYLDRFAPGFEKRGGRVRWEIPVTPMDCHTWACHYTEVPGFNGKMSLYPQHPKKPEEMDANFQAMLQKYFDEVNEPRPGDLITFSGLASTALPGQRRIAPLHVGVFEKSEDGRLVVLSKIGAAHVIEAPVELTAALYHTPLIQVYRRKPH